MSAPDGQGEFLRSLGFPNITVHRSYDHFDFIKPARRILVIGPMGSGKTEFSARVWRDSRVALRKGDSVAGVATTAGAVGVARALGVESACRGDDPDRTWVSTTDADTEVPAHWPAWYQRLVQARIDAIEAHRFVRLIEDPEFKRRWAEDAWEVRERDALRSWLLDRLETPRYVPQADREIAT